ncbi:MAG: pitrilysin family protein [Hyphomonadaceae bacterium]|nr:pitrilysin family protein [Hyphomonadaceae bacterium]
MTIAAAPERIALPNGVRLALDPMPGLETAALGVWVRVGARWEAAAHNGVAHLFEHMAFKGAGGRDALAFAEAIENVGGYLNAATSYERTSYTARVTAEHAPFALDLLADMIRDPHWRGDDLEKEKDVVAQERGEAFDQPDDRVFELHQAALFPDHPLGRPILGEAETVAAVDVETLRAFRDAHTTPARVVVCIAGGYDRAAVADTVSRRFGDLPAGPMIAAAPARPVAGEAVEARKLEQTHLVFSAPAPAAGHDDAPAAWIFSEIFGGGMASRLFQDVRETRGLAYAIHSWLDVYEDAGRVGVYAGCAARHARTVAHCVADAFEALARDGPTDSELKRAKAVVSAQTLMGAEAPLARAEARAAQVFLRDRIVPFAEIRARIAAVTADDVRAIAAGAMAGPVAAAAVGPRTGLGAPGAFRARFG